MSKKCWVFALANHKGGVGKTSTSINLAGAFALTKRKVLLIDFDPQGSSTVALLKERPSSIISVGNALLNNTSLAACIRNYTIGKYDILPANDDLTAFCVHKEHSQVDNVSWCKEHCLLEALKPLKQMYDIIIIDCPPALNLLTMNALCAADELIVPCTCEYYSVEGLGSLMRCFEQLKKSGLAHVHCMGIVRTMFDQDQSLAQVISEDLKSSFGNLIFTTIIPFTYRISEAPSIGLSVIDYDRSSLGSKAYMSLAGEIITRLKARYSKKK